MRRLAFYESLAGNVYLCMSYLLVALIQEATYPCKLEVGVELEFHKRHIRFTTYVVELVLARICILSLIWFITVFY